MGCPENLIRDILVAEANRKLAQQLKSLCAKIPNLYSNFLSADGQVQVVFDHLNKARFTCLSEIFGNDITIDDDQIGKPYRGVRPDAGLLSDEQVESIARLESELSKKIEAICLKSRGFLTASDKAEIEAAKDWQVDFARQIEKRRAGGADKQIKL